jgi:prophage maintenance system killer protein
MSIKKGGRIIIYKNKHGKKAVDVRLENETIWANLNQIAVLFGRDKSVISRHISNIFKEKELDKKRTVAKNATVQIEGKRKIEREIEYYNLDMIISVGYRVNSKKATQFRVWATSILKEYLVSGHVINKKVIASNYNKFIETVEDIKALLPSDKNLDNKSILELVKTFADTWLSLDAYDKDDLIIKKVTKRKVKLTAEELIEAIITLKSALIKKKEATDLFARERQKNSIDGIIGSVMQAFGGEDMYPGLEEKAAHLLYFMIKNHPFVDGNKRSGAYSFVWFLRRVKLLNTNKLSPVALTAITLLIAESNPKEKDKMTALVVRMLRK